jgi:hypothetical protein
MYSDGDRIEKEAFLIHFLVRSPADSATSESWKPTLPQPTMRPTKFTACNYNRPMTGCFILYFTLSGASALRVFENRVKVKLSLCLISLALCHEDIWGSGGSSTILNLGTRWRRVISFTSLSLYPQGKSPRYPLDRRLCGPQSRSGCCGEEKNLALPGIEPVPNGAEKNFLF